MPRHATARPGRGFIADYSTVLRSPWARTLIVLAFVESGLMFGAFTYVGADLHLRFGVGFTLVGLFVGSLRDRRPALQPVGARAGRPASARSDLPPAAARCSALAFLTLAFEPHA